MLPSTARSRWTSRGSTSTTAGNAVLDARWWVYGRNGEKLLRSGRSTISEPAEVGDYTAAAAALSRALGAMSQEIAQAIAVQGRT